MGTIFHNDFMPLVRYRLSDRTRMLPDLCACGRTFPLIAPVTGKYEDAVFNKHGSPISPSVLTFAFKGVKNIAKSQVVEVGQGMWQIRFVPMPGYTMSDEEKLVKNIRRLVYADTDLEVVLRDNIPNTAAGKFRWAVNEAMR